MARVTNSDKDRIIKLIRALTSRGANVSIKIVGYNTDYDYAENTAPHAIDANDLIAMADILEADKIEIYNTAANSGVSTMLSEQKPHITIDLGATQGLGNVDGGMVAYQHPGQNTELEMARMSMANERYLQELEFKQAAAEAEASKSNSLMSQVKEILENPIAQAVTIAILGKTGVFDKKTANTLAGVALSGAATDADGPDIEDSEAAELYDKLTEKLEEIAREKPQLFKTLFTAIAIVIEFPEFRDLVMQKYQEAENQAQATQPQTFTTEE